MEKAVTLESKQASKQAKQRFGEASSSLQPSYKPTWKWIDADKVRTNGTPATLAQHTTMGRALRT
eukprot:226716-Prorocentrum_lima.AAC.1